jgi:hypothetical protein
MHESKRAPQSNQIPMGWAAAATPQPTAVASPNIKVAEA